MSLDPEEALVSHWTEFEEKFFSLKATSFLWKGSAEDILFWNITGDELEELVDDKELFDLTPPNEDTSFGDENLPRDLTASTTRPEKTKKVKRG
jgi:hypothetical protein